MSSERLLQAVDQAKKTKRKLFCAYVTLGYPNLQYTEQLLMALPKAGVDILELGFPFSDPLADGPVIQEASEHALRNGVTLKDAYELMKRLRSKGFDLPTLLFTYYNPLFRKGIRAVAKRLSESGFDGLIIPDLPPDEDPLTVATFKKEKLAMVFLATPTSSLERLRMIANHSDGFLYYVSVKGVTGMRVKTDQGLTQQIQHLRKISDKPILIGFGVSSPEMAHKFSKLSDGVIVGSAIVNAIKNSKGKILPVTKMIRSMAEACRGIH